MTVTTEPPTLATGPLATDPLRIVVADDQPSVREGLALLLDMLPDTEVVATAADGQQALDAVAEHRPAAILLDIHMPVLDGVETTRRLVAEHPDVAIVILTTYLEDADVLDAIRAGARGFLTKDADRTDIARALHAAAAGLSIVDPRVHTTLLAATRRDTPQPEAPEPREPQDSHDPDDVPATAPHNVLPDNLTEREVEILALIVDGLTNPEIAARLYLSINTVKSHINRMFAKTGSRDRAAAISYAHRHKLME
ncbi:response regulator transcription factor [Catenulispora rubra]|uniref:response regulator transcription factor n=1 Tax=Catenulispora rubra TaxID=280293 RepID=UPI00189208F8|nr:response regulator transcription factor [Catenulispora rubra]